MTKPTKEMLTIFIDKQLKNRLKDIAEFEDTGVSQVVEEWIYEQYAIYMEELNEWIFDRATESKYDEVNI